MLCGTTTPELWNADFTFAGTQDLNLGNGSVTLGADRQVTVTANTLAVGGKISSGYSLTKRGNGTLALGGANTYTGPTTVAAGKLAVNGSLPPGSIVNVQSGGTLAGAGTVGGVTVADGGCVAPGNSVGTLALAGNLSLDTGALLDFELAGPTTSDLISMRYSTLTLNGQRFSDFTFTPLAGFGLNTYVLIDAGTILGKLGANTSGMVGEWPATISTRGDDLLC